jgi:hypothetical protein
MWRRVRWEDLKATYIQVNSKVVGGLGSSLKCKRQSERISTENENENGEISGTHAAT